ncbi:MAG: hypothetical protein KDA25_04735 [Phycisphaerales bacterium]|nr:hypothetical protein [Phycisphaerales bacterium]
MSHPPVEPGTIAIIGAGTMGAGIAQVAAAGGWTVELMDVSPPVAHAAVAGIGTRLDRLVEKGRLTAAARDDIASRLLVATCANCLAGSDIVLEAIVEDLDVKTAVLTGVLPALRDDAIIATNTSSLSVTELGDRIGRPSRTVGMHFFNPAPLMKLVEVIAGRHTDAAVVDRVAAVGASWGKVVARAADVPGFIVNHVARPYYLEAFRILEDGFAPVAVIDGAMKTLGGFRMGPFELTDLIGQDVNAATTRSVWAQLDHPPLLHPSRVQERLVAGGHLGRKSGRGVYDHSGEAPTPALAVEARSLAMSDELATSVDAFVAGASTGTGSALERYVFARVLVSIIAQGALANERGVADRADIDAALMYGVNYPKGPFTWADEIGIATCCRLLDALNATVSDGRFAVPESLSSRV